MKILSRILQWDTEFFGFGVGRIDSTDASDSDVMASITALKAEGCRLIYVFTNSPLKLENVEMSLVDRKRSYILRSPKMKKETCEVSNFIGKSESLYNLGIQSGEYSRYNIDCRIGETEFRRLYKKWVDNAVNGEFGDYVFSVDVDCRPVGFITARRMNDMISIGLFATDKEFRGHGIGGSLIQRIENVAFDLKTEVEVTTQADNINACRFYSNRGYEIREESLVYHVWI